MTDEPNETAGGKPTGANADAVAADKPVEASETKSDAEPVSSKTESGDKPPAERTDDAKPAEALAATTESKPAEVIDSEGEPKPAVSPAKTESQPSAAATQAKSGEDVKPAEVPHFVASEDSYATDARRPTSDYRVIAIVLAIASIACLGFSAWSRQWLYNPRTRLQAAEYSFGPRGMFRCRSLTDNLEHKTCEEMSNSELIDDFAAEIAGARHRAENLPAGSNQEMQTMAQREATEVADMLQTSPAFVPTGWITLVSAIVAAVSLLITLLLAIAGARVLLPVQPTTTALLGLMIGLVAGCVFVATKPGAAGFVGVSYGFWVFGAGSVLGLAAATLLNKHIRPVDPDLLEDSMDPEQF